MRIIATAIASSCVGVSLDINLSGRLLGVVVQDRYRVIRLIGAGGMGSVYEVEHLLIGRRFAMKTLHPRFAQDDEAVARFHCEARAAAAIGDPHIVEVVDMGVLPAGAPYIILELLEGCDLGAPLASEGPLPIARALEIADQGCEALARAHEQGIIHRDIKPDNMFITRRGGTDFVTLLDFGISKVRQAGLERRRVRGASVSGARRHTWPPRSCAG